MNADWLFAPHNGIGRLSFSLSPQAVASVASLYGNPSPLNSHAAVASDVEEVIDQTGATLSARTIDAMRRAARASEFCNTELDHGTNADLARIPGWSS